MRKLTCTLLIIAILLSSGLLFIGGVHASAQVGGTIASDTTWTQANSPYQLTGQVTVPYNVTLTFEPGVTVNFGNYYIQVSGTLQARGTSDSNLFFFSNVSSYSYNQRIEFLSGSTAWNEQNSTGCIIENAAFNNVTLTISSSPKINSNSFLTSQYVFTSINVNSGSPQISNNIINCQNTGISVGGGSPVISSNTLLGNGRSTGISSSGNSIIQKNLVVNGGYGITVYASSLVQYTVVAGNTFGISGMGGDIEFNTVAYNSIGLQVSGGSVTLRNNNIYSNSQASIVPFTSSNLDASNNWWGTTNAGAINQKILDSKIYNYVGTISFVPFLTQPVPSAPPLPSINLNNPSSVNLGPTKVPTPPPATPLPPTPTDVPTPTPVPTPSPTPKIMPGSPLSMGGSSFADVLSRFDITALAELVLIVLGVVWVIVILVSIDRNFGKKTSKKQ